MANSNSSSSGTGFITLLAILFIALKLLKYIDWSWWYVLMPVYIPAGIAIVALIIISLLKK